jgi:mercuric ion transport protein
VAASRAGTRGITPAASRAESPEPDLAARQRLVAVGSILGSLAASSCCIVPLILFSLGIGGAWIGNLTTLASYKPLFLAGTGGMLGYGFYLVYWARGQACANNAACARPIPSRIVQLALWIAIFIAVSAFAFDYIAPLLLRA